MTKDDVNHPKHYTSHPSGVECIDVVEHMNFNIGNAVKYCWRAGQKGDLVTDLEKARWYLDREIQRLKKAQERLAETEERPLCHPSIGLTNLTIGERLEKGLLK